jgi:hypothetical protein
MAAIIEADRKFEEETSKSIALTPMLFPVVGRGGALDGGAVGLVGVF